MHRGHHACHWSGPITLLEMTFMFSGRIYLPPSVKRSLSSLYRR